MRSACQWAVFSPSPERKGHHEGVRPAFPRGTGLEPTVGMEVCSLGDRVVPCLLEGKLAWRKAGAAWAARPSRAGLWAPEAGRAEAKGRRSNPRDSATEGREGKGYREAGLSTSLPVGKVRPGQTWGLGLAFSCEAGSVAPVRLPREEVLQGRRLRCWGPAPAEASGRGFARRDVGPSSAHRSLGL